MSTISGYVDTGWNFGEFRYKDVKKFIKQFDVTGYNGIKDGKISKQELNIAVNRLKGIKDGKTQTILYVMNQLHLEHINKTNDSSFSDSSPYFDINEDTLEKLEEMCEQQAKKENFIKKIIPSLQNTSIQKITGNSEKIKTIEQYKKIVKYIYSCLEGYFPKNSVIMCSIKNSALAKRIKAYENFIEKDYNEKNDDKYSIFKLQKRLLTAVALHIANIKIILKDIELEKIDFKKLEEDIEYRGTLFEKINNIGENTYFTTYTSISFWMILLNITHPEFDKLKESIENDKSYIYFLQSYFIRNVKPITPATGEKNLNWEQFPMQNLVNHIGINTLPRVATLFHEPDATLRGTADKNIFINTAPSEYESLLPKIPLFRNKSDPELLEINIQSTLYHEAFHVLFRSLQNKPKENEKLWSEIKVHPFPKWFLNMPGIDLLTGIHLNEFMADISSFIMQPERGYFRAINSLNSIKPESSSGLYYLYNLMMKTLIFSHFRKKHQGDEQAEKHLSSIEAKYTEVNDIFPLGSLDKSKEKVRKYFEHKLQLAEETIETLNFTHEDIQAIKKEVEKVLVILEKFVLQFSPNLRQAE